MTKKWIITRLLWIVLSGWLLNSMAYAGSSELALSKVTANAVAVERLSDDELSGFGCLIGTVGLFTAGYWAGPSEAIMLWGGGLLTPSNSAVLAISILGGLGYAGCSFGSAIAPTLGWTYEQMGIHSLITTSNPPAAK